MPRLLINRERAGESCGNVFGMPRKSFAWPVKGRVPLGDTLRGPVLPSCWSLLIYRIACSPA